MLNLLRLHGSVGRKLERDDVLKVSPLRMNYIGDGVPAGRVAVRGVLMHYAVVANAPRCEAAPGVLIGGKRIFEAPDVARFVMYVASVFVGIANRYVTTAHVHLTVSVVDW
jgi:hypothetical protein